MNLDLDRLTTLHDCCFEYSCIRNFIDLPFRIGQKDVEKLSSYPSLTSINCPKCSLPKKTPLNVQALDDLESDLVTELFEFGYRPCFPGNTITVQCWYMVKERWYKRHEGRGIRRNVLNAIFLAPDYNAFVVHHQTFRYKPYRIDIHLFMKRLLNEAIPIFHENLTSVVKDNYFCHC
jgi:hypothetical protein